MADLATFLAGDTAPLERQLEAGMREASAALDFERAGILRDKLEAVRTADAVRQMELDRPEDLDVLGLAEDELEAAVQVFHVRAGRVVGRSALFVDKVEDLTPRASWWPACWSTSTPRPPPGCPARSWSRPCRPTSRPCRRTWPSAGADPVAVKVPLRGPKAALLETVHRNAGDAFVRHRLQRTSDHNSRARALEALQRELRLPVAPLRIECYDMSHLQGTDYVGSMVVFEDGLPKKSDYRHFKVATVAGNDDYAAMEEVLTRRLTALLDEEASARERGRWRTTAPIRPPSTASPAATATRRRFAYPPQLLLIDGGLGQLHVATRVLDQLGLTDRIPVASLAKSFEEVYLPDSSVPVRLPRTVRGPLPAAAAARRGPPLRHLVPPDPAGQADDGRRPRRRQGARPQAPVPPGRAVRRPGRTAEGDPGRADGPIVVTGRGGCCRVRAPAHAVVAGTMTDG